MNEKGFTLIETLLVLVILGTITFITSQIIVNMNENREINQFFNQLQLDIQRAQSYSIEKKSAVYLTFLSSNTYRVRHLSNNVLFERKLPENVRFEVNSNLKTIEFTDGKVPKFGTLIFHLDNRDVSFIVYIERGRMRLVE